MQSETLVEEFSRLVREYKQDDGPGGIEAWNLIADFAVDNAEAIEAALSAAEPVSFEGQNYNCPCVHPSQCDESCLKPAPSVAVKAPYENDAIWARFYRDGKNLGEICAEFKCGVYDLSPWLTAPLLRSAQVQDVAVAEIVSAHGDPEAFGERELVALIDIQKFPYRTKLYAAAPAVKQGEVE